MLGSFEELIPKGLCFVQLWSAALYVQGIVEGLFGFEPHAYEHRLRLQPRLPTAWPSATLRRLQVGDHVLTVHVSGDGATITHESGAEALLVEYVTEGEFAGAWLGDGSTPASVEDHHGVLCIRLQPGERVRIDVGAAAQRQSARLP